MGLFSRAPKVGADGYERKTLRGYADKGSVAKMLSQGWEVERVEQIQLSGNTLKQGMYTLRRKVS